MGNPQDSSELKLHKIYDCGGVLIFCLKDAVNRDKFLYFMSRLSGEMIISIGYSLSNGGEDKRMMIIKKSMLSLIRFYQKYLSGLKRYPTCKYYPTCSNYAIEAVEMHGIIIGSFLSVLRIIRCNPFSKGGYDPVPLVVCKSKKHRKIKY